MGQARDWPWSSVRAHLAGRDDRLVSIGPLLDRATLFADLIESEPDKASYAPRRIDWRPDRRAGLSDTIASTRPRPASEGASSEMPEGGDQIVKYGRVTIFVQTSSSLARYSKTPTVKTRMR
jgi:putative transposase